MGDEMHRHDDLADVRDDIEMTRQRMSGTLDEIENIILRKKEKLEEAKAQIQRKLDVGARIREKPLTAAGAVLGAGLLLGLLTGGPSRKSVRAARRRSAKWEKRARRLLEIARSQEQEIEDLRVRGIHADLSDLDEDLLPDEDDDYSFLRGDELYPLDPEFDDETIEYRPARFDKGPSLKDRFLEFAANTVESVLDSVPSRR
jgi:ElaB/YqjD/DUF883 family membrane-anchored ribosome-binding protein